MDPELDPDLLGPVTPLPADADILPSADPDATYAAWRLDRAEERP